MDESCSSIKIRERKKTHKTRRGLRQSSLSKPDWFGEFTVQYNIGKHLVEQTPERGSSIHAHSQPYLSNLTMLRERPTRENQTFTAQAHQMCCSNVEKMSTE